MSDEQRRYHDEVRARIRASSAVPDVGEILDRAEHRVRVGRVVRATALLAVPVTMLATMVVVALAAPSAPALPGSPPLPAGGPAVTDVRGPGMSSSSSATPAPDHEPSEDTGSPPAPTQRTRDFPRDPVVGATPDGGSSPVAQPSTEPESDPVAPGLAPSAGLPSAEPSTDAPTPASTPTSTSTVSPTTKPAAPEPLAVTVYYQGTVEDTRGCLRPKATTRQVSGAAPLRGAVLKALMGPSVAERRAGFSSVYAATPATVTIDQAAQRVTVDFADLTWVRSASVACRGADVRAPIAATVAEFGPRWRVAFTVGGSAQTFLTFVNGGGTTGP